MLYNFGLMELKSLTPASLVWHMVCSYFGVAPTREAQKVPCAHR